MPQQRLEMHCGPSLHAPTVCTDTFTRAHGSKKAHINPPLPPYTLSTSTSWFRLTAHSLGPLHTYTLSVTPHTPAHLYTSLQGTWTGTVELDANAKFSGNQALSEPLTNIMRLKPCGLCSTDAFDVTVCTVVSSEIVNVHVGVHKVHLIEGCQMIHRSRLSSVLS